MIRYETRKNKCDCHPETCTHWSYLTWDTELDLEIGKGSDDEWQVDEQTELCNQKENDMRLELGLYYE